MFYIQSELKTPKSSIPMILTITLIFTGLVVFNILLLKLSCNKTIKSKKVNKKPVVLRTRLTTSPSSQTLGATGR